VEAPITQRKRRGGRKLETTTGMRQVLSVESAGFLPLTWARRMLPTGAIRASARASKED
jgi:hypothetical protein